MERRQILRRALKLKQTNTVNESKMVQPGTGRHQQEMRKTEETGDFMSVNLHKMEIMWGGGEQIEIEEEKRLPHFSEKMLGSYEQIK